MHVEYYVFEKSNQQQAYLGLCQLIEKWYQEQLKIAILCSSTQDMQLLDQLLWTFNDQSFIPHAALAEQEPIAPVCLCLDSTTLPEVDVIINLSNIALTSSKPARILVEIVFAEQSMQQLARERYKQYRELGYQLKTIRR